MAQSMSPLPAVALHDLRPTASRSNSLASTASNSSATSLRRRSRTRTRTLPSGRRGKNTNMQSQEDAIDTQDDTRPASNTDDIPPLPLLRTSEQEDAVDSSRPVIPKRSPRRLQSPPPQSQDNDLSQSLLDGSHRERAHSSVNVREVLTDSTRGRQTRSEGGSIRGVSSIFSIFLSCSQFP